MKTLYRSLFALAILGLVSCSDDSVSGASGNVSSNNGGSTADNAGQGGSLARFEIANGHLYIADQDRLLYYSLSNEAKPNYVGFRATGMTMETLFARDDQTLFSGNQQGMSIYNIGNGYPMLLDTYEHILSCDPVVANQSTAYVTLNAQGGCQGLSQMDVLDITTLNNIVNIETIEMESPRGLTLDGDKLYVCDDGIKRYSIANGPSPVFEKQFEIPNALDIIERDGYFFVSTPSGFTIVDLSGAELQYVANLW